MERRKKVWKLIRRTKKEVNELVINNKITIDEWRTFFRELYKGTSDDSEPMLAIREEIPLSKEDRKRTQIIEKQEIPCP